MHYPVTAIATVPPSCVPLLQHALDTYASETNKVYATWREFSDSDLGFRPHARSSSVEEILKHQLLSERRFFAEFLGLPEPPATAVLPSGNTVESYAARFIELAAPRLPYLAERDEAWWMEPARFFDTTRQRAWIFWRRVLHTSHHRTQLTVYLRLLDKPVPSTYGPTADVTWEGATPTLRVENA